MKKEYRPLKNNKSFRVIIVIFLFLLVNFIGLVYVSTDYIETLKKTNSTETIEKINSYIKPFIIQKYNYYIYTYKWNMLLNQTPKLTNLFKAKLLVVFIFSNLLFLILVGKRKPNTYGDAEWGTYDDLKKNPKQSSDINFLSDDGVVIGQIKKVFGKFKLLYDSSNVHMALVIPSRGGKGVGYIIPSLVSGLKNYSTFITDIKKENFDLTSWYRAKILGHRVLKFEPMAENSSGYNFLSEIRYGTNNEIEDCRIIGTNIVGEDKSNDKFWGDSARDIISTLACYVHYREVSGRNEKKLNLRDVRVSLNDVVSIITNTDKSLYDLFKNYLGAESNEDGEIESGIGTPQDFILPEDIVRELRSIYTDDESRELLEKGLHPFVAKQFGYLLRNSGEQTLKSVSMTAKTKLQVFELPSVVKNLKKSDFKIIDLVNGDNPTDLYFVIKPKDLNLLAPLVRLLTVQISSNLMNSLSKKKHRIVMLMDEFASFGKMSEIETNLGYYAGYGIKFMGIFQGLDQVNAIYGKENKIMSGCQIQIFGRPNDDIAPEYLVKTLGKKTIYSKSKNMGFKGGGSISEQGKDLLSASEIRQLPDWKAITITGFKKPLLLDKLEYYKIPELLERTQHQPIFYKDGKIIFEKTEDENGYKYSFSMNEKDFHDNKKYNEMIENLKQKYKTNKIG